MFKKAETGTLTITEVEEDSVDGDSNGAAATSSRSGDVEEELTTTDDDKPLIKKGAISWRELVIYNFWVRLGYLALLCLLLGLVVPFLLTEFAFLPTPNTARGSCALNISYRFDCLPSTESLPSETECHALGCCYDQTFELYVPICFHSIPSEYGYHATNVTTTFETQQSGTSRKSGSKRVYRVSEAGQVTLDLTPLMPQTNLGTEAWSLRAVVQLGGADGDVARVVIFSPEHDTFPDDFPSDSGASQSHQLEVTVTQEQGGDFNITVTRMATGEEILETVFGPLVYGEGFAELTTRLPTSHLYGLGLRRNVEFFPGFGQRSRWPLFTDERLTMSGNVSVAVGNSGAHPFFMNFEKTPGYMYGLYLRTSAPIEASVTPVPAVVFRSLGTLWDLRVMAGPTPRDISRQFTQMVGRPAMPPYWALGYHLCRAAPQGDNFATYNKVVEGMREAQIPYESDCIDSRLNYPSSFTPLSAEVQAKVSELKRDGRRFTLVQYPFVTHGSQAYTDSSAFLLKHNDSSPYYGSIEGLAVGYPDYADENTLSQWLNTSTALRDLYSEADAVFLLHNTPLNQATLNYTAWNGTSCHPNTTEACCPASDPPFLPQGVSDLNNHSLCAALVHPTLTPSSHLAHHNAYGLHHHERITSFMQELRPSSRPMVASQSTQPGSGHLGGAFGESFGANFLEQKVALVQVLELGLYGVNLAGAPVCGSRNDTNGNVTSEWCLRGHQMAVFWPLMMSHYEFGHQPRHPTDFDKSFSHQLAVFIRMRYTLLPYFYTLFYEASQHGTPVVRPLFYEFPEDQGSRNVSSEFMVGSSLLVSPVLQSVGKQDSVDANIHFPPGRWYNFFSGAMLADSTEGVDGIIPTLLADVNVYVRGGEVFATQGNLHDNVRTTADARLVPFTILAALCCGSSSHQLSNTSTTTTRATDIVLGKGSLYLDDGKTPLDLTSADPSAEHLTMEVTPGQLRVTRALPASGGASGGLCSPQHNFSTLINTVIVYGLDITVTEVSVGSSVGVHFTQDADTSALTVRDVGHDWCLASANLTLTWT